MAADRRTKKDQVPAVADIRAVGQCARMGKRSGVPHREDELQKLNQAELQAELERCRVRLSMAASAKMAKRWHTRIHWLESTLAQRD